MTQLSEAISIIREVLQLNVADSNDERYGDDQEVKVSAADSKEIQARIIDKFGCSKQTAYYYYFYRGKKAMTKDHNIKFVTDRSSPKRKKTADDVVAEQLANLKKEGPASPFRL
tara:strand:+ start:315 stop:656 length:342 start_codon:yes stop_codon:yes gene_type:complete